jgi:nucleoid DNA-binding protein
MSAKTLTKEELVSTVAERTGLTQAKTHETIQVLLDTMQCAFKDGRKVEFRNFGVFRVARRAERTGRNPANVSAGTFTIPAKNVVKFRIGADLDKAINS